VTTGHSKKPLKSGVVSSPASCFATNAYDFLLQSHPDGDAGRIGTPVELRTVVIWNFLAISSTNERAGVVCMAIIVNPPFRPCDTGKNHHLSIAL
jgi:hypothetical protein